MSNQEKPRAKQLVGEQGRPVNYKLILMMAAMILLVLPFITTFNEFLTAVAIKLGVQTFLQAYVVPVEARLIAAILKLFGLNVSVSPTSIYVNQGINMLPVYISWNCVGWQSFILFSLTLVTGLQGPYTRRSKLEAAILGYLGTFLVNLIRISLVVLIAFHVGKLPATLIHDYGSTIFILLWLIAYWYFYQKFYFEYKEPEDRKIEETARPLREMRPKGFTKWRLRLRRSYKGLPNKEEAQ